MKRIVGSVTVRGQVTLPAEVRRVLGLRQGEKVVFQIEGEDVRLLRPAFTLDTIYRSVPPISSTDDYDSLINQAKEEKAGRTIEDA